MKMKSIQYSAVLAVMESTDSLEGLWLQYRLLQTWDSGWVHIR